MENLIELINFTKLTKFLEIFLMVDVITIIASYIIKLIKYNKELKDNNIINPKFKNTLGKMCLILFPFLAIIYGICCAIDGMIQAGTFNEGNQLILLWMLIMAVIAFVFILFPVFIVKAISSTVSRYRERVATKAIEAQKQVTANKDAELQILKMKYKPIKCSYCGTMNPPKYTNCKNCGGVLENRDNRLLS